MFTIMQIVLIISVIMLAVISLAAFAHAINCVELKQFSDDNNLGYSFMDIFTGRGEK